MWSASVAAWVRNRGGDTCGGDSKRGGHSGDTGGSGIAQDLKSTVLTAAHYCVRGGGPIKPAQRSSSQMTHPANWTFGREARAPGTRVSARSAPLRHSASWRAHPWTLAKSGLRLFSSLLGSLALFS